MRWHIQNLNDGKKPKRGGAFRHGRGWLRLSEREPNKVLRVEWLMFAWRWLSFGFGPGPQFQAFLFGCGAFFELEGVRFPNFMRWLWSGEFRISTFDRALWITPWGRSMEYRNSDPWWRKTHSFEAARILFGRMTFERLELDPERPVLVPMAEGAYRATVKRERLTWSRSRWPWWPIKSQSESWHFAIEHGIPEDGKGENGWDCDEDGTFGLSVEADSLAEAIGEVVGRSLKSRVRRGGEKYLNAPWGHSNKCVKLADTSVGPRA